MVARQRVPCTARVAKWPRTRVHHVITFDLTQGLWHRAASRAARIKRTLNKCLVLLQETHRLRQRVAPEGITQFLSHHHLEHCRAVLALRLSRRAQGRAYVGKPLD